MLTPGIEDMIPKPIYELLPYLYVLGGLIAIISMDSILGKFCGVILIVAGVVIHQMRARFRSRRPTYSKNSGRHPKTGWPVPNSDVEPASRISIPNRFSSRK
jgi:hypothetical protein